MKTLVVYYSRKGYTEQAALQAVKENETDFLCIETAENTAGYNGFLDCMRMVLSKKEPVLFPYDTDIASYDKVIICAPVWCGALCAPMAAFIRKEKHNIKSAEYIFLHLLPGSIAAVADETDQILRLKREKFTAIHCVFGHIIKEETI